jgi:predicted nucleotide-binding protein
MPPTVFVGSSTEGKAYANAVAAVLESLHYNVRRWWSPKTFRLGDTFIESLISAAEEVDAAVFVATPDDHRMMRDREDVVSRDNVLFEYGLFSGKLGRSRTALAIVGNAVRPTDLQGINCISMPKKEKQAWTHYQEKFVRPKVGEWLRNEFETPRAAHSIADLRRHIYKCLKSEADAKKKKIFLKSARNSPFADYLVLRGRNILSGQGEIADLRDRGDTQLRIRLLMVDFESLTKEAFEEIKKNMDLQFADLGAEKRLAEKRLADARKLFKNVTFTCRLLPISLFPAIKLRLYDRCGFFYFYYTGIGGKRWSGKRGVFCVDEPDGGRSPLLETLRQMYNHLWDQARDL